MAVDPVPAADSPDATSSDPYPAIFRQQILRSMGYVLAQLRGATSAIPDDELKSLALHVLDFALKMAPDQPEAWSLSAPALTTLAPGMAQAGHRSDWADYLERGLATAQAQGDRANAAALHFHLGTLHQLQGDLGQAQTHFVQAATGFAHTGQQRDQAQAINRQAYMARLRGQNQVSLGLVDQALGLLAEDDAERGYSAFVQGCNAYDAQEWAQAAAFYQQALDLWQEHGETRMVAWNLTNLGTALRGLKAYGQAADRFRQALALFDQVQDPTNRAITQMNLGTVYLMTGRLDEAQTAYVEAEAVFQSMKDDLQLAKVYNNLGMVYAGKGLWEQAEETFNASIQCYAQMGDVASEVNTWDSLGELYRDSDRPDLARSTWQHALARLATIPDAAAAPHLQRLVSDHLAELEADRGNREERDWRLEIPPSEIGWLARLISQYASQSPQSLNLCPLSLQPKP